MLIVLFGLQNLLTAQTYYEVERLPVNTSFNEMAPFIYKNGIIFSSDRKNDIVLVTVDLQGNYLYNLYFTEKKSNRNWTRANILSKELINRYNQSSASITADGSTLYYTATTSATEKIGDRLKDTLTNGIFIASLNAGEWGSVTEFPYNNPAYDVGTPCITPDGKRLYFASRNPSGFGGYDIYFSDKNSNNWSFPVNLGPNINTSENEVYPFIFDNNRLYFSSRGHKGKGGMDILFSDYVGDEWTRAIVMPEPFNSEFDDFTFVANASMDTGYFTSNRTGSDDIFRFVSTIPSFTDCKPQVIEEFCYYFEETGTINLDTTTLEYEWDLGDGTKIKATTTEHCYKEPGFYLIQLNVIDTLTGTVTRNETSYDLQIDRMEQTFILSADTAVINEPIEFNASMTNIKKFDVLNYYWDFGDGSFGTGIQNLHKYSKPGKYTVKLGVTGDVTNTDQKACVTKLIVIQKKME